MRSVNNRWLISVVVLIVITFGLGLYLALKPDRIGKVESSSYLDPWTGEVVTETKDRTVETFGSNKNEPIYLGLDRLIDHGFSFQQIQNIKLAINNYSSLNNNSVKEVSIKVDEIIDTREPTKPDEPYKTTFDIKFNRKNIYNAKVEYFSITDIRLYLSDLDGKVFYDSQTIDKNFTD